MSQTTHTPRRLWAYFCALALVPLLLILQAPLLAAVVPGALLTVVSLEALEHRDHRALTSAHVVGPNDYEDLQRIANATVIEARSRPVV